MLFDLDDIECINKYHEELPILGQEKALERCNFGSRDGTRRPMCWDGTENGGFSTAKPWITAHSNYRNVNLEADRASEKSVFRFYKELLKLRRENDAILYGGLEVLSNPEDAFFKFRREYNGEAFTVICNFEQENTIEVPADAALVLHNYADFGGTFRPYEVMVLKHN